MPRPDPFLDERAPEAPAPEASVIGRRRAVADTHATGRMRSGRARPDMGVRTDTAPRDDGCGPPNATAARRCGNRGAAGDTVGVHTPATADAGRTRPPAPPAGHAA